MTLHPAVRLGIPAALFVVLVMAPRHAAEPAAPGAPPEPLDTAAAAVPDVPLTRLYHEIAKPGARVTVVEFADFGCPYCARFEEETFPALATQFVETGKVRWRFVPFVLGIFPNAGEAMRAATCAAEQGEGAFWKMSASLFRNQDAWKDAGDPEKLLRGYAVAAGADADAWNACYTSQRAQDLVKAANALAARSGVRSTPSFFIDGKLVQGALPLAAFRQILEQVTGS